jgi:hypothetical protein
MPPVNQYGGFLNLAPQQFHQFVAQLQAAVNINGPKTPPRTNKKRKNSNRR